MQHGREAADVRLRFPYINTKCGQFTMPKSLNCAMNDGKPLTKCQMINMHAIKKSRRILLRETDFLGLRWRKMEKQMILTACDVKILRSPIDVMKKSYSAAVSACRLSWPRVRRSLAGSPPSQPNEYDMSGNAAGRMAIFQGWEVRGHTANRAPRSPFTPRQRRPAPAPHHRALARRRRC